MTAPVPIVNPQADGMAGKTNISRRQRWSALAVLMLPVLLVSVDNTVLSFAVPKISQALQPTGLEQLWIIDAYSLVLAGLLVPMGTLGDRIGRKKLLIIGSTGFTLVSVAAVFAPSGQWLIVARAALGFFGAMLMPSTLSLIRNIFPHPQERRKALAIWAAAFSSGAALGPVVGGFILEHFDWGAVFMLALPVLLPFLLLAPFLVPESRDPRPGPLDLLSIVLIMIGMTAITYTIKHFAKEGLDLQVVLTLVLGLLTLWLFVYRQLRRPIPMLDVGLFKNRVFSGAIGSNLLAMISMVGFLYFVSQHLQLVSGLTPLQSGLFLVPGALVTMVSGLLAVRLVPRVHPASLVALGLGCISLSFALVLVLGGHNDAVLMLAFLLMGLGSGAAETLANDLMLSAVPANKAGGAAAISETSYELGAVLGTALLGGILTAVYSSHIKLPQGLTAEQAHAAQETLGGASRVAEQLNSGLGADLLAAAQEAFDAGVVWTAGISVLLMLGAALLSYFTLRGADPNAQVAES